MFTGIIEFTGTVRSLTGRGDGARLSIAHDGGSLRTGESIAVNGLCLTVVEEGPGWVAMDLSPETLRRSTLGDLKAGDRVNLERPLRPSDRLGGHFVTGHIDGVGWIVSLEREGNSIKAVIGVPSALAPYLVDKGSVAVDGISLTVGGRAGDTFAVYLIPYTMEMTNLRGKKAGDRVNIETDILGKYVESFMKREKGGLTPEALERAGFL